ncbi:MAG: chorismate mutase [Lentisphaeria bacterium]
MNNQLLLSNIRAVLVRLEETILFALIERGQFRQNPVVYRRGAFPEAIGDESLAGFLLRETECAHARMRRYTSPDELPFFTDLPAPLLPALRFDENPLRPNTVNFNPRLRTAYEDEIVPHLCRPGDDQQYGSTAVCDTACLQAISRRVHYGKFVAESKYQAHPERFLPLLAARDAAGILAAITDAAVEAKVLERVELKAGTYCREISGSSLGGGLDPEDIVEVYRRWLIPLTKEVEVAYLLAVHAEPAAAP